MKTFAAMLGAVVLGGAILMGLGEWRETARTRAAAEGAAADAAIAARREALRKKQEAAAEAVRREAERAWHLRIEEARAQFLKSWIDERNWDDDRRRVLAEHRERVATMTKDRPAMADPAPLEEYLEHLRRAEDRLEKNPGRRR